MLLFCCSSFDIIRCSKHNHSRDDCFRFHFLKTKQQQYTKEPAFRFIFVTFLFTLNATVAICWMQALAEIWNGNNCQFKQMRNRKQCHRRTQLYTFIMHLLSIFCDVALHPFFLRVFSFSSSSSSSALLLLLIRQMWN